MDDEVEAVKVQRIYRCSAETPEACPAVVVARGPVRQSEARQIPGYSAKPSHGELAEQFPVAERGAQHAMNAHDGLAVAFGAQEALYAAGGECLACMTVSVQDASRGAG
jgi:hypothetical protein